MSKIVDSRRGRPGESRYKNKRDSVIPYREFALLVDRIDPYIMKSLVALLYYAPLRIAEIVGDRTRKWKVLSAYGRGQFHLGELPEDWIKTDQSNNLWVWRHRDSLPGIRKEDISLDGLLLLIKSEPLKHGRRDGPIEIDIRYPYMERVVDQWEKTEPKAKVWDMTTWYAWNKISTISNGELYPHAFRFSKATDMARDPDISLADMLYWFGWAQARTADNYIQQARSSKRVRDSTERHLPKGWDTDPQ